MAYEPNVLARGAGRGNLDFRHPDLRDTDRATSAFTGGVVALWALRRGGLLGLAGLVAGGALLARAWSGRSIHQLVVASDEEKRIASDHGWSTAAATTESVTILRPRHEVYRFWRDFRNLAKFMDHVKAIEVLDSHRSRWTVKAPAGQTVSWVAHVTEDRPDERIAWSSDAEADVRNAGWVEFRDAPGGGTEVTAMIAYEPPAGQVGRALARLSGREPSIQAADDLQRLKRLVEGGEVALGATANAF